jgi:hypothetical protein
MIHYVKSADIDKSKWDECVSSSPAALVYAYSWYLDLVAPGWTALVKGDYKAVMPLPLRRKYTINYVFQPPICQQLGIFSSIPVNADMLHEFLSSLPKPIRYLAINLNFSNSVEGFRYHAVPMVNYELDLNNLYEKTAERFSSNTRKNIAKAVKQIKVKENIPVQTLVDLKRKNPDLKMPSAYYKWMGKFCQSLIDKGVGEIIGAEYNSKICAAAFFVHFGKRVYYLIPVSDAEGKKNSAMFAIIDSVLQKYSGTNTIFDFEGSIYPGIARFFEGFGAYSSNYFSIRVNRLPLLFKMVKRFIDLRI